MRLQNLGYASTAHRAQGSTVDTAHALTDPETASRELLYVAMTRGRRRNDAYVIQPDPHEDEPHLERPEERTVTEQLARVLARSDADLSATETLAREADRHASLATLLDEYDLLAREAQAERWAALLDAAPLPDEVFTSPYYEYLEGALARHDAAGHDVGAALISLAPAVASRGDQADPAALLGAALDRATTNTKRPRRRAVLRVAGLIPAPREPIADDLQTALNQRQALIEAAAKRLAQNAVRGEEPWTNRLQPPEAHDRGQRAWLDQVATMALYRERYAITGTAPLGNPKETTKAQQALEYQAAAAALRRVQESSTTVTGQSPRRRMSSRMPAPGL